MTCWLISFILEKKENKDSGEERQLNFLGGMIVFNGNKPAQEVVTASKEYNLHHTDDQKWVQVGEN